jgi:hypothetical protein
MPAARFPAVGLTQLHGLGKKLLHPRIISEDADRPSPVFNAPMPPPRLQFRKLV